MATKNLRKIREMGTSGFGFTSDFNPNKYPVNAIRYQKYVDTKKKNMLYHRLFDPLYKKMLAEELGQYFKGGHKLNSALKREIKEDVKDRAKKIVNAQIAAAPYTPEQGYKEQEVVLQEG